MARPSCVLAFSGGLDTSAIVPWLIERGYDVHALIVDVGQREDWEAVRAHALALGAVSATVRSGRAELVERLLPTAIGLGATYEESYRLGTALARPIIALEQVRLARELGCKALVHGATGKGNDQLRFEFAYRTLAPDCEVIAPWKEWSFAGRAELAAYLAEAGCDTEFVIDKLYSLDENLWHLSIEGGALEQASAMLDVPSILEHVLGAAPDTIAPAQVTLDFQAGVPVALDGERLPLEAIVACLNARYARAEWAWDLVLENRFTGVKSRGVYLNPAAKLLHAASDALARCCLNKPTYALRADLAERWADMLYSGEYFSQQREAIEAAARSTMTHLQGSVTLAVAPQLHVVKIDAPQTLFRPALATFEASEWSHAAAAGFIELSWLRNVGCVEDDHESTLETDDEAPSGARAAQPLPGRGLVSAGS